MTVDYAQQAVIRTLVGYRKRLAEGVDALDRAIEIIQEFGHINPADHEPAATAVADTSKVRHACTRAGCGETFETGPQLGAHMNHHKGLDREAAREKQAAERQTRTVEATRQRLEEDKRRAERAARDRADDADRRLQHTLPEPLAPPTGRRIDITAATTGLIPTGLPRRPPDTDRLRRQAYEDIDDEVQAG